MLRFPPYFVGVICAMLLAISTLTSIASGALSISLEQSVLYLFDAAFDSHFANLKTYQEVVILDVRLPRTVLAAVIGAQLALCGAVMQGVFRNPLADPGIVGASGGAALGAAIVIVILPPSVSEYMIPGAAFAGALGITFLVYKIAQSPTGTSVTMILLAGVAVAAFTGAAMGFLNYLADETALRDISLWSMGSVSSVTPMMLMLNMMSFICLLVYFQRHAKSLNALLLGESEARHLGIDVERIKLKLIIACTFGVGISVAASGVIGFVGLVVPHFVRLLTGPNHATLLPLSALLGALLLVVADILARLIFAPAELPIGLITALIGAPFFTLLLLQQRKALT